MEFLQAFILGVIEGFTEFLPISSTGHLLVAEDLLGFKDDTALFTVVIQLGAILAAVWYFRSDLVSILSGITKKSSNARMILLLTFIGILPASLAGFILEKSLGISDSLLVIAWALILGGIALWIIEEKKPKTTVKEISKITPKKALTVGVIQCLSLIPGVSRSGSTIAGGLLVGLDRKTATIFSFYLSIPIMFAASIYKIIEERSSLSSITGGSTSLIIGLVTATVTAFLAVKWLLRYVQTNSFKPFAYYRIIVGSAILLSTVFY